MISRKVNTTMLDKEYEKFSDLKIVLFSDNPGQAKTMLPDGDEVVAK